MDVTRPALWPSCVLLCILELMRAEGGAVGPAGLITGRRRPWGGPGYNRSPDWGQAWRHRGCFHLRMSQHLVSCGKAGEEGSEEERAGCACIILLFPPSALSPSSCRAGLGGQGTRQRAGLGAIHSSHTAVLPALLAREPRALTTALMEGCVSCLSSEDPQQGQSKTWILLSASIVTKLFLRGGVGNLAVSLNGRNC